MNPLEPYVRMLESKEAQAIFGIPAIGPILGLIALTPVGVVILLVMLVAVILTCGPGILLHAART